jgi:hypothetical protein
VNGIEFVMIRANKFTIDPIRERYRESIRKRHPVNRLEAGSILLECFNHVGARLNTYCPVIARDIPLAPSARRALSARSGSLHAAIADRA